MPVTKAFGVAVTVVGFSGVFSLGVLGTGGFDLGVRDFCPLGLVLAALLDTTFGVDAFFVDIVKGRGGAAFGDKIFVMFLGVGFSELFSIPGLALGERGILAGVLSFFPDFFPDLGVLTLAGEFFTGPLNGEPGGNSNRKLLSIMVKVSL